MLVQFSLYSCLLKLLKTCPIMFPIIVFLAKMIFKLNLKIADYLYILDMTLNLTAAAY